MNGVRASPVTEACFTRIVQTRGHADSCSESGACAMERCSPPAAPFPPRPPQEVVFPCSVGSQVVRRSPTSPARTHPPFGLWPSRTGLRILSKACWRSPGSRACCFLACAGSQTTQDRTATRVNAAAVLPSSYSEGSRHPDLPAFRSSITPPTNASGLRFETHLAVGSARLEVRMESLSPFLQGSCIPYNMPV
jgi:hypothetical protein